MNKARLFIGLFLLLFLVSCNDKQKLLVHHATVAGVSVSLKDYAGINGFRVTYVNEESGRASYRVYVGRTTTLVPAESETTLVKSTYVDRSTDTSPLLPSREVSARIKTSETPARQVDTDWSFGVQLFQRGDDVSIQASSSGGFDPGQYVRGFVTNLVDEGYFVVPAD